MTGATLRAVTYNVHSCRGSDRRHDPARIAEVIAGVDADIVALQELDVGRKRTGGVDQAAAIASHLTMMSHFHPALHVEEERYGDAILTSLPSRVRRASALPSSGEPRGAIWIEVEHEGRAIQVINTHFGLGRRERILQAQALVGPDWIAGAEERLDPLILLGDFNAMPWSRGYKLITERLQPLGPPRGARLRATFPARLPLLRLDHVFANRGLVCVRAEVIDTPLARKASDHLPLLVEFGLSASLA